MSLSVEELKWKQAELATRALLQEQARQRESQKHKRVWQEYIWDTKKRTDLLAGKDRQSRAPYRRLQPEALDLVLAPPVKRGLWERLMTIAVWASFILLGIPLQH